MWWLSWPAMVSTRVQKVRAPRSGGVTGWVFVLRADGGEEAKVPGAEAFKGGEGRGEVVGGVAGGPDVLVEGLDGRQMRGSDAFADGRQGLAEAEAEGEFAIGEVRG